MDRRTSGGGGGGGDYAGAGGGNRSYDSRSEEVFIVKSVPWYDTELLYTVASEALRNMVSPWSGPAVLELLAVAIVFFVFCFMYSTI